MFAADCLMFCLLLIFGYTNSAVIPTENNFNLTAEDVIRASKQECFSKYNLPMNPLSESAMQDAIYLCPFQCSYKQVVNLPENEELRNMLNPDAMEDSCGRMSDAVKADMLKFLPANEQKYNLYKIWWNTTVTDTYDPTITTTTTAPNTDTGRFSDFNASFYAESKTACFRKFNLTMNPPSESAMDDIKYYCPYLCTIRDVMDQPGFEFRRRNSPMNLDYVVNNCAEFLAEMPVAAQQQIMPTMRAAQASKNIMSMWWSIPINDENSMNGSQLLSENTERTTEDQTAQNI